MRRPRKSTVLRFFAAGGTSGGAAASVTGGVGCVVHHFDFARIDAVFFNELRFRAIAHGDDRVGGVHALALDFHDAGIGLRPGPVQLGGMYLHHQRPVAGGGDRHCRFKSHPVMGVNHRKFLAARHGHREAGITLGLGKEIAGVGRVRRAVHGLVVGRLVNIGSRMRMVGERGRGGNGRGKGLRRGLIRGLGRGPVCACRNGAPHPPGGIRLGGVPRRFFHDHLHVLAGGHVGLEPGINGDKGDALEGWFGGGGVFRKFLPFLRKEALFVLRRPVFRRYVRGAGGVGRTMIGGLGGGGVGGGLLHGLMHLGGGGGMDTFYLLSSAAIGGRWAAVGMGRGNGPSGARLGKHEQDVDGQAVERLGKPIARDAQASRHHRRKFPAEHENFHRIRSQRKQRPLARFRRYYPSSAKECQKTSARFSRRNGVSAAFAEHAHSLPRPDAPGIAGHGSHLIPSRIVRRFTA